MDRNVVTSDLLCDGAANFELIQLVPQERDAFVAALLNPPAPATRLIRAAQNYQKNRPQAG